MGTWRAYYPRNPDSLTECGGHNSPLTPRCTRHAAFFAFLSRGVTSVWWPCSATVGETQADGLPSFVGLEDILGTDTGHKGGQWTLSCCLSTRTCCFLSCQSPWCAAGCKAALGLTSFSNAPAVVYIPRLFFFSGTQPGMGHRSLLNSGPPDLAAGSVITLGPGAQVGLLAQGPVALRARGFPLTLLLKPT